MTKKKSKRAQQKEKLRNQQRRTRIMWGGIATAVLLLVAAFALIRQSGQSTETAASQRIAPEVGAIAPDFELASFGGESMRLSDFRGQPVAIMFMHTW